MSKLTHGLPPVPPMESDVRERILQNVLGRMEAPAPSRGRRLLPLLTAAAVLLVAIVVTVATTLTGTGSDPRPAAGVTPTAQVPAPPPVGQVLDPLPPEPLPADQLPPPSGNPDTDAALARCATAVVRSGRAAEYPPTSTWRNALTGPVDGGQYDRLLEINEAFGCLLTPESVILSGPTGTPVGDLQLVRISSNLVFVLNPERLWFTFGNEPRQHVGYPVMAVVLPEENDLSIAVYERGDLPGSEPGGPGDNSFRWSGPVPELVQAVTVVDRELPRRADTLDDAELANCIGDQPAPTITGAGNELWVPVGRHDVGGDAPTALVSRIGDAAAGFCIVDPVSGPAFAPILLMRDAGPGGVVVAMPTEAALGVLLLPPDGEVARVEIAPTAEPAESRACTILHGLIMCTLEVGEPRDPLIPIDAVITAYAAGSDDGQVLYPR